MANEIVKYENSFNKVVLSDFNSVEMNILFAVISRIREQGSREVTFSERYLKQLTKFRRKKDFFKYLMGTYNKLSQLKGTITKGSVVARFTLFTGWAYDQDSGKLTVQVNPDYLGYFNDLENWTRFALDDFTGLRSTYSKTMFRLLKQYRTIGRRKFSMEEFREQLGIPKSYRPSDINRRVITYIQEELSVRFQNLKIERVKNGRRIIGYLFTWKPEPNRMTDFSQSQEMRQAQQLNNIRNNDSLTEEQKWLAEDRLLGLQLGTTKAEQEKQRAEGAHKITAEESSPQQLDLLQPAAPRKKRRRGRRGRVVEPTPAWVGQEENAKKSSAEDVAKLKERLARRKRTQEK